MPGGSAAGSCPGRQAPLRPRPSPGRPPRPAAPPSSHSHRRPSHARRRGGGAARGGCSLVAAALAGSPVAPGAPGALLAARGTGGRGRSPRFPPVVTRRGSPRPHSTAGAVRGPSADWDAARRPAALLAPDWRSSAAGAGRGGGGAARSWRG